jgi:hypothetical protein
LTRTPKRKPPFFNAFFSHKKYRVIIYCTENLLKQPPFGFDFRRRRFYGFNKPLPAKITVTKSNCRSIIIAGWKMIVGGGINDLKRNQKINFTPG